MCLCYIWGRNERLKESLAEENEKYGAEKIIDQCYDDLSEN